MPLRGEERSSKVPFFGPAMEDAGTSPSIAAPPIRIQLLRSGAEAIRSGLSAVFVEGPEAVTG
jgi:hypothetical protein